MDDKNIELLTVHIQNRTNQLKQLLDQSSEFAGKSDQQDDDKAANPNLTINAMVDSKLVANFRTELNLLLRNLVWLQSGDEGNCELCGQFIP